MLDEYFVRVGTVASVDAAAINMGPPEGQLAASPNFMDTSCDFANFFRQLQSSAHSDGNFEHVI